MDILLNSSDDRQVLGSSRVYEYSQDMLGDDGVAFDIELHANSIFLLPGSVAHMGGMIMYRAKHPSNPYIHAMKFIELNWLLVNAQFAFRPQIED